VNDFPINYIKNYLDYSCPNNFVPKPGLSKFCKFRNGSSPSIPHGKKKMDPLFLGVPHVVPGCVLWIFS